MGKKGEKNQKGGLKKRGVFFAEFLAVAVLALLFAGSHERSLFVEDPSETMERIVEKGMESGRIPGLSIYVRNGPYEYRGSFGYADTAREVPVSDHTLFEIGSNSKAFTGYAIHRLAEKGYVRMEAAVETYLPGFAVYYKGVYKGEKLDRRVTVTVGQLLRHVSGLSKSTITRIPEGDGEHALEACVDTVNGTYLSGYPGERFEYATINYDILGLIIQNVTGKSYEAYMSEEVFPELGLESLGFRGQVPPEAVAKGYKLFFWGTKEYGAPVYRGNTPAGYVLSDLRAMSDWVNIQLGHKDVPEAAASALQAAREANLKNPTGIEGAYYAAGWFVREGVDGTEQYHGGENPNYSSYILLNQEQDIGICVLANINTMRVQWIAENIMNYSTGNGESAANDFQAVINSIAGMGSIVSFLSILCILVSVLWAVRKKRFGSAAAGSVSGSVYGKGDSISIALFLLILSLCLLCLPRLVYEGAGWKFAWVWFPFTFPIGVVCALALGGVFFLSSWILRKLKVGRKAYIVPLIAVSVLSGMGNAVVIFVINAAIADTRRFQPTLFLYFLFGLLLYMTGQKIVRFGLINMANHIIYETRLSLVHGVIHTKFDCYEGMELGEIQSCINQDTETISGFVNTLVSGITNLATILLCIAYLGILNKSGILMTLMIIVMAAGMYGFVCSVANAYWEKARDCQSRFYSRLHDFIGGFQELKLNRRKRKEFLRDMREVCEDYREKSRKGGCLYAFSFLFGESVFTIAIGTIAFLFPLLFAGDENLYVKEFVFILLYLVGPLSSVLRTIPDLARVRISFDRIRRLRKDLESARESMDEPAHPIKEFRKLSVKDVEYQYQGQEDGFRVGPIRAEFHAGSITFLIGGNGSGKSTFAKLLTGLYLPQSGCITVNDCAVTQEQLRELFSAVYSDFYLFDQLYGLDERDEEELAKYLRSLKLEEKVKIYENRFHTIRLSTGQKKRLALLISYLEKKPILLLDEWAAEQEPAFREYFYHKLLPDFRSQGKCIVVISHDDRYYDVADTVMVMECGKVAVKP
ncbi:MAG: cyclic peptide export ABC transporter [Clostridium sp.]|jgi:cyclic peptide transporter|nr:cyclic peptide export ABC transporter [Clostridium sp.]